MRRWVPFASALKRPLPIAAVIVIALASSVAAIAYWTTHGSGSASASLGTLSAATISAPASVTSTSVTVSWTQQASVTPSSQSSNITYTVERQLNGGSFVAAAGTCAGSLAYNTSSCVDSLPSTPLSGTYTYRVIAHFHTWTAISNTPSVSANLDSTAPVSAITFPSNGARYNAAGWTSGCSTTGICGTASDVGSGVASLAVTIQRSSDAKYWNATSSTWASATVSNPASTSDAWAHWSAPVPVAALTDGVSYTISATATDAVGNVQGSSAVSTFTYDTTAPVASITLQAASDTGSSNSDNVTKAANLVFNVAFTESVTGLATNGFSNVGTATGCAFGALSGSGTSYTVTASSCSEGTVRVRLAAAVVSDAAGNQNVQTDGATVTIDRTAPLATITLQSGSDTGSSNSDNITNATSLVFNVGFTESVTGLVAASFSKGSGTATGCTFGTLAGAGTSYSITASTCSEGTLVVRLAAAAVSDAAGNQNVQTDGATVTIDRTAPTLQISSCTVNTNDKAMCVGTTTSGDNGTVSVAIYTGGSGASGTLVDTVTGTPASGNWSTGRTVSLTKNATYSAVASQTDVAGNSVTTAFKTFVG